MLRIGLILTIIGTGFLPRLWNSEPAASTVCVCSESLDIALALDVPAGWNPVRLPSLRGKDRYAITTSHPDMPYVVVELRETPEVEAELLPLLDGGQPGCDYRDESRSLFWSVDEQASNRIVTIQAEIPRPLTLQVVAPRQHVHRFAETVCAIVDSMRQASPASLSEWADASGATPEVQTIGSSLKFEMPTSQSQSRVPWAAVVTASGVALLAIWEVMIRYRENRRTAIAADRAREIRMSTGGIASTPHFTLPGDTIEISCLQSDTVEMDIPTRPATIASGRSNSPASI